MVSHPGLLAGVDVGTTSVKVVLLTPQGEEVASGQAPTRWIGGVGGVEAGADEFRVATMSALRQAVDAAPSSRVTAVGVASMAEAGVLVDGRDQPLTNVIAWHDQRDEEELRRLVDELGGEVFRATTGLPLWTQWSLTKHRWLVDHEPAAAGAVRRYNIAEWVARGLGADPVSELSLASRTGWLELETAQPWPEALEWSGAGASMLGDLVRAGDPVGTVPTDHPIAQLRGATLTIGGHDHQAAVIGAGAVADNVELDSCGTAEALLRTVHPTVTPQARLQLTGAGVTVGWHVLRDRWCVLGATQGGLVLEKVLASLDARRSSLPRLDALALTARPGATTVRIATGGSEFTTSGSTAPEDVWRAAAMAMTREIEGLSNAISASSAPREGLVVAGGWANSEMVLDAKLALLGTFERTAAGEAGARGAALLAGLADGTYATYADMPPAGATRFVAPPSRTHTSGEGI